MTTDDTRYELPYAPRPCIECKFSTYDSFHYEWWCTHNPPPVGLDPQCVVHPHGTCGYWESDE